ncbi:homeobox-leucine zipper protein HOX11-like isoform X2 [Cynara cardunculus var. scolymus]|uniref:Homeobox, conserved site-containing protein n=1 Tax=Cynara cardunculus var. scolymus TaxID=59895 RepID=A0A103Y199_CYNCS|nr:homeobox-leucine zipper protein HOX11-like isoform X2 [Cynara cardunculus var. scolymus]KVI00655.1 Homeobox, conserved site-containing protein [Cynara cardunculus var. scolymus]
MELGLSLGDAPSKATDGFTASTTTTTPVNKSLGFCMALGMNPSNGTTNKGFPEKPQIQDDQDDGDEHDDDDDDDEEHEKDNQRILKENGGIKEMIVSSQRICSLNPPVQLDLLPSAPVPRHTPFPWSSDNGSSEGGSSGNAAAGRGFDVKRMPAAVGTEEATSSFRLDFMSYRRTGNVNGGSKNNKRGFEIGNEAIEVERASSRASDEDENGISRKKLRLSKEQSAYLEESFKEHNTLNPKQKLALAEQLNLRPRQVEVWFQNRRARTKLKQTEVDYEYLKRCCETLTDENRRLHKELQELRALKTSSNPFYRQLPATTLTMCPSCERVATTSAPPPSATLSKQVEQNSKKASTTPLTLSAKPRSLIFPVSHAPPCNNSHHQPAAPS